MTDDQLSEFGKAAQEAMELSLQGLTREQRKELSWFCAGEMKRIPSNFRPTKEELAKIGEACVKAFQERDIGDIGDDEFEECTPRED